MITDIIGYSAGLMTICVKIPQIFHTIKTKKTNDLSHHFLFIWLFTHISWVIYGTLKNSNPVVISDTIGAIFTLSLIIMKIHFDHSNPFEDSSSHDPSELATNTDNNIV